MPRGPRPHRPAAPRTAPAALDRAEVDSLIAASAAAVRATRPYLATYESLCQDAVWGPLVEGKDAICSLYAYAVVSGLPREQAALFAYGPLRHAGSPDDLRARTAALDASPDSQEVLRAAAISAGVGPFWQIRIIRSIAEDENNSPDVRMRAVEMAASIYNRRRVEEREERTQAHLSEGQDGTRTLAVLRREEVRSSVSAGIREAFASWTGGAGDLLIPEPAEAAAAALALPAPETPPEAEWR